jgi:hypothetical protein
VFGRGIDYMAHETVTHDDLGNSSQLGRLFILRPNDPVLGVGCSSDIAHSGHDGHTGNENLRLRVRGHIECMYVKRVIRKKEEQGMLL